MRIDCFQINTDLKENPRDRISRVLQSIEVMPQGVDLLVLPEHWIAGAFNTFSNLDEIQNLYSNFIFEAKELSLRKKLSILTGSGLVLDSQGKFKNTTFLISPFESAIKSYSKIHPFRQELGDIAGDKEILTFDICGLRVSVAICYDLRFPEVFRQPENIGSDMFIIVAAWPLPRIETWQHLLRSRAIENQAFVIGVNGSGVQESATLGGRSMIIGPDGNIFKFCGTDEERIKFDLDPEIVHSHRREFPYLRDIKLLPKVKSGFLSGLH